MKNKITSLLVLLVVITSAITKTQAQNYELITGEFSLNELKEGKNLAWFKSTYEKFKPDETTISKMKKIKDLNDLEIYIYLGTWCPDSRRELPRLVKILDEIDFNLDQLHMIGVTRSKKVPNMPSEKAEQINIINVPTIIVYKNGKELNRFVEYAVESIEEDLYKIMAKLDYSHSYDF